MNSDLNALDPAIWPANARRVDGELVLAGVPVSQLATEHGTPAYVLDEDDLRQRAREWSTAFAGARVYYAGKAFLCISVARWVVQEGLSIDVCTGGELAVALAAGVPGDRLSLHGNNKSDDEISDAIAAGVGTIIIDAIDEIGRVAAFARAAGVRQRVLIRVTVGVEAHTHEFIATAHEDQKFGLSLSGGVAERAAGLVLDSPDLELVGLHSHIGSQIFDTAAFEVAARRITGLAATIRDRFGVQLPEINLGGGLGIAYVSGDDPEAPKAIADRLRRIVEHESASAGLPMPHLAVEPGRAIVGQSGVTLYRVGSVKDVSIGGGVTRRYVSVDGGMSDNIRSALYDADYTCVLAGRASDAPPELARVVGKHCESGDIVVRETRLPADVRRGDLLAVAATGAYCRSMASNYNHVGRPPVVAVRDGESSVLVRRESVPDLLALDTAYVSAGSSNDGNRP